jgi:Tol biopolymer transport system component
VAGRPRGQAAHPPAGRVNDRVSGGSPDGSTIAFANDKSGELEIYTVRIDGTHLTRFTHDFDFNDEAPSFSPDGTRIVFTRFDDFGAGIAVMDADGSNMQDLMAPSSNGDFKSSFTPDGRTIVFESQRKGLISAIWSIDADGSHARCS